tara:strand:+ start:8846 stop:9244 length:399 start_codon:yes stop_codon:yes gene_type:complete
VTLQLTAFAAITKGDVVAVSPLVNSDEQFYTTQLPASGNTSVDDNEFGIFAVAQETIASGAKGMFLISGITTAKISGTPAIGAAVGVKVTTKDLIGVLAGAKVVAYMLETGVDGDQKKVMFDGYNGFGNRVA